MAMKKTKLILSAGVAAGALLGLALTMPEIPKLNLGGEKRIAAYLSTDKMIYRPRETIYFRIVALDAFHNFPVRENHAATLKIKGPRGDVVKTLSGRVSDSTGGIAFRIPGDLRGGVYRAFCSVNGSAEAERSFEIRAYTPPRLRTQIEFLKKAYGAGESVHVALNVKRAEGGVPENADVTLIARLGDREIARIPGLKADREGNLSASFQLPGKITETDGTVAFLVRDGGVLETAAKSLPLVLKDLDIIFYPEGGDMVAGLPNRIYFSANLKNGKPADLTGKIMTVDGRAVADAVSRHEGRGVFRFTPLKNTAYFLKIDAPAGIEKRYPLPAVKESGAVLSSTKNVYPFEEKILLRVLVPENSDASKIVLSRRERIIASADLKKGANEVALDAGEHEGVLIATVYDSRSKPVAERLVFRAPKFVTNVRIIPESRAFVPGGKVKLNILATDRNGAPVESVIGLNVTDESVIEMTERREQAPSLPVMIYLENDVKELADARIYFDAKNPDSSEAVDLLLGTQGWRRFITVDFNELVKQYENPAKRALAWMRQIVAREYRVYKANFAGVRREAVIAEAAVMPAAMREEKAPAGEKAEQAVPQVLLPAEGAFRRIVRQDVAAKQKVLMPVSVREYAHKARPDRIPNERRDFTETIYWNAGIRTNPRTGKVSVEFDLPDSITTFRVTADAIGNNGALGVQTAAIRSVEPFYIEPKLPVFATAGDRIQVPVALVNSMDRVLKNVNLSVRANHETIGKTLTLETLNPGERGRIVVTVIPAKAGVLELTFHAAAEGYADKVVRRVNVLPSGFPVAFNAGGLLNSKTPYNCTITIPADVEAGSVKASAKLYPSPLAGMEEALNALLRQPCGCFEQTSSTTYPLVMAQQYFLSHQGVSPEKIRKAAGLLEQGYEKLTGFESENNGYEWFGGDPGHEALTAYGLMQFHEMKEVMPVDRSMLERTEKWLLSRRDGNGGFLRNERALDSFGRAPAPTTNAYILWTLLESGTSPVELSREIEHVKKIALQSEDSYIRALGANILFLAHDGKNALSLASGLAASQEKNGAVGGGKTTITCSGGDSLKIETTSLAVLAWLRIDGRFAPNVESAMKWLFERCKSGRFGSTQSTILALKAINAYDKARAVPKNPGRVRLVVDGRPFGNPVSFTKESKGTIELPDFSIAMTPGTHTVGLVMEDGSEMPFTLEISCNTKLPVSAPDCAVKVETALSCATVKEGEIAELNVTVRNGGKDVSMPLAVIGIPAGFEVRYDQLKELVSARRIAAWEMFDGGLVLYWRALRADETVRVPVSLKAVIPGSYTAPASRAWLYYTDELKNWCPGVSAEVL